MDRAGAISSAMARMGSLVGLFMLISPGIPHKKMRKYTRSHPNSTHTSRYRPVFVGAGRIGNAGIASDSGTFFTPIEIK